MAEVVYCRHGDPRTVREAVDGPTMIPRIALFPLTAIALACPAAAQLPELYRSVDRVTWVVDNIDRVAVGWEKVGLIQIEARSDAALPVTFRGKPVKANVRMAS